MLYIIEKTSWENSRTSQLPTVTNLSIKGPGGLWLLDKNLVLELRGQGQVGPHLPGHGVRVVHDNQPLLSFGSRAYAVLVKRVGIRELHWIKIIPGKQNPNYI